MNEVSEITLKSDSREATFTWPKGKGPRINSSRTVIFGNEPLDRQFLAAIRENGFRDSTPS